MSVTTPAKDRVLIIGSDVRHGRVALAMEEAEFQVMEAGASSDGLGRAVEDAPHVVVLNVDMLSIAWMDLLSTLRNLIAVPIIVVGLCNKVPLVQALEQGADICLTPQASPRELLAYIRALLRRHSAGEQPGRRPPFREQIPARYAAPGHAASWLLPLWG